MSWEPFIIVGDSHGDMIHEGAQSAIARRLKDKKFKHRIHIGDAWDFRSIRRGASEEDKEYGLEVDFQAGKKFLELYKPTTFIFGNHDVRPKNFFDHKVGMVRESAIDLWDRMLRCLKHSEVHDYHAKLGIVSFGEAKILHGYMAGQYSVYQHAMTYGTCFVGHIHTLEVAQAKRFPAAWGMSVGYLADSDLMDYMATRVGQHRWRRGWVEGAKCSRTGKIVAWQVGEISDGFFVTPDGSEYGKEEV